MGCDIFCNPRYPHKRYIKAEDKFMRLLTNGVKEYRFRVNAGDQVCRRTTKSVYLWGTFREGWKMDEEMANCLDREWEGYRRDD